MGRPSEALDWLTEENLTRVQGWARNGLTSKQLAHNIGISESTVYEWKKKYPEFSEAIKKGKEVVDFEVENALLKKALGYEYEETITEIRELPDGKQEKHKRITKKVAPPDTVAMIFWLKNRKPSDWQDKREATDDSALERLDNILAGVKANADIDTETK